MPAHKTPRWTAVELAILREHYPVSGLPGTQPLLPNRSWHSIYVKAHKLGLATSHRPAARLPALRGDNLEEAIRLRGEGWSFARIGAHFGCSEGGANNAIVRALAERRGGKVARRDARGCLLPDEIERLRVLLKLGAKPCEIQRSMGISASRIAEERRRYNADLKARGKALLPPPGGGEAYPGAKLEPSARKEVERLFLEGFGTKKVSETTGVSKTSCVRIRAKLAARLRRKGERLPGCDLDGKRHVIKDSVRRIPEESKARLRQLIMERVPVARAAKMAGIGSKSAYAIRDALNAELEARGETLPAPILPGRVSTPFHAARRAEWLRKGDFTRFRILVRKHGEEEARRILKAEYAAERERMKREDPFAYQLERARNGAGVSVKIPLRRPDPTGTLGGIASAAMEAAA